LISSLSRGFHKAPSSQLAQKNLQNGRYIKQSLEIDII